MLVFTHEMDAMETFGLSYTIGYCLNIFEYLLVYCLGIQSLSFLFVMVVALVSLFILYKKRARLHSIKTDKKMVFAFFAVLAVWFVVSYITYTCRNIPASLLENTVYPEDLYYWAGSTASLAQGFPPRLLIASGFPLNYHYFSSMQVAFMHTATGIDINTLSFGFYKIQPAFVLVFGAYAALRRLHIPKSAVIAGMAILLFTSGPESKTLMTFSDHMMRRPFGIDIAMGISLFLFVILYLQDSMQNISYPHLALFLGGYFVFVGAKAPMAIVFLAFLGVVCLFWLLQKKYKQALCYGVPSLFLCAAVYKVFVVGNSISTSGLLSSFSILGFMQRYNPDFLTVFNNIASLGFPGAGFLGGVVAFLWWVLCCSPVVFGLLFLACLVGVLTKTKPNAFQVAAVAMLFTGAVLTQFFPLSGGSSLYFTMAAMPFALLAALMYIPQLQKPLQHSAVSAKLVRAIAIGLVVVILPVGVYNYVFGGSASIVARDGLSMLQARINGTSPQYVRVAEGQDFWRASDVEALAWVAQNTPMDAIVLTDRPNIDENPNFRYQYSYYMERQAYIDGLLFFWNVSDEEIQRRKEIVVGVMNNDLDALRQAKEEGVGYIVWTKRASPMFSPETLSLELLFDNETISIFAV